MNETISQNRIRMGATPPSDVNQVGVVIKYEVLKYLRSKRLLGLIIIEALVLLLITVLPPLLGNDYATNADAFINGYMSYVTILIVIGATLFAGDAIVSEFQGRTGYLLFPKPVKRSVLLAGKFIASAGAMFLVLIAYYLVALLLGLAITGGFSTLGVESLLLAMLYSLAALAVGYLISSVMKGATGALILTFALFLFILTILMGVLTVGGVEPWFLVNFAGGVVGYITQVPYPTSGVGDPGVGPQLSINQYIPDIGVSVAVMLTYLVVSLVLAYFFFKRREMSA
jgi:ABC-2 type transport system permease protein